MYLDPQAHTIAWPTGADFDPSTLHDWPEYEVAFRAAAEQWRASMTQQNAAVDAKGNPIASSTPTARRGCGDVEKPLA